MPWCFFYGYRKPSNVLHLQSLNGNVWHKINYVNISKGGSIQTCIQEEDIKPEVNIMSSVWQEGQKYDILATRDQTGVIAVI